MGNKLKQLKLLKSGFNVIYTPIKPTTIADHLLIPIFSFKKKCANIVIKKGVTKNKAVANPKGNTVNEI